MQGLEKQLQVLRQRLSDSENNGSRDLNKYTEKQFHEQLELLQQEVKHLTAEREMNLEEKRRYHQQPQHQAVQQPLDEIKTSKLKIPSLPSKQVQRAATTAQSEGERVDHSHDRTIIAEYSQHERPVIKKQGFNHINFAQQASSIAAGSITRNDYPSQLSRGNNNSNVSHAEAAKQSDEEVFRQQRQLAEQRRQQQEAEMVKNQEYNSSLNYAKILAPHVRSNPADTSPNNLAKSLKAFNNEHEKLSYQDISLKQYKMEVEKFCVQETAEEITKPGSGGKKKFKKQNLKKVSALNDEMMESNSNEEQSIADVLSSREVVIPIAASGHAREKKTINFLKARSMAAQFERDLSSESGSPIRRSAHQRSRSRSNDNSIQPVAVIQPDKPPESSSLLASFEFKKKPAAAATTAVAGSDAHQQKKIVVNPRTREAREAMKGFGCGMCKEMYDLLGDDFCQKCSRHRYEHTPPHTPEAHYQNMSSDNADDGDEEKQQPN